MSPPALSPALSTEAGSPENARAEGSLRAWVMGGALGVLFAVSNVYVGLKTGIWESGCVTSALLAFGGLSTLGRFSRPPSPLETNLSQTTAVALGAMPASAGLMGTVPALALMGLAPSAWAVAAWGLSLGVLGVLFASVLRRRLLEEERLPFPTGAAAAELISTLHATGMDTSARARGLGVSGLVTALVVWLRDARGLLPGASLLPGPMLWGVGWNPMLLGMGALLGVQAGVSLLLGALVAWGALAPGLVDAGVKAEDLSAWLVWPGLGLLLGGSVPSLLSLVRALPSLARDLRGVRGHGDAGRMRWVAWGLVPLVLGVLAWNASAFELGPVSLTLALVLAFPLCAVCARATGQSDIAPMSPLGQLTQVGFGMVAPGQPGLNVGASGVVAGAASQTSASLWSLQAGRLLGANPTHQLFAQLSGLVLGAAVAVPTYFLLVSARGLGSTALPAPTAHQFKAIAELTSQGLSSMPPGSVVALGVAFVVGVGLSVAARGRWARLLPSAAAVGMGFLLPAFYSVTLCLGALLAYAVVRFRPASAPTVQAVGSGAILGESLLGVVLAALG